MGALELTLAAVAVVLFAGFFALDVLVGLTDWSEDRRRERIRKRRAAILAEKAEEAGGPGVGA